MGRLPITPLGTPVGFGDRRFREAAVSAFEFLVLEQGFAGPQFDASVFGAAVAYRGPTVAVDVTWDKQEDVVEVYVIRLRNGDLPLLVEEPQDWIYLSALVSIRAPHLVPALIERTGRTLRNIDKVLTVAAACCVSTGKMPLKATAPCSRRSSLAIYRYANVGNGSLTAAEEGTDAMTAAARDFQLVIQGRTESMADFDAAVEVENAIAERLGDLGSINGHDAGSGEVNIFIITPEPRAAFDRIRDLLNVNDLREPKVAYRAMGTNAWTVVHPPGGAHFRIK